MLFGKLKVRKLKLRRKDKVFLKFLFIFLLFTIFSRILLTVLSSNLKYVAIMLSNFLSKIVNCQSYSNVIVCKRNFVIIDENCLGFTEIFLYLSLLFSFYIAKGKRKIKLTNAIISFIIFPILIFLSNIFRLLLIIISPSSIMQKVHLVSPVITFSVTTILFYLSAKKLSKRRRRKSF